MLAEEVCGVKVGDSWMRSRREYPSIVWIPRGGMACSPEEVSLTWRSRGSG